MIEVVLTENEAKDLEDTLIYHLEQCYNTIYDMDEVAEGFEPYNPFDGCSNCEVREMLMKTCEWLRNNKDLSIYVGENNE
jgi:hypothetical protein